VDGELYFSLLIQKRKRFAPLPGPFAFTRLHPQTDTTLSPDRFQTPSWVANTSSLRSVCTTPSVMIILDRMRTSRYSRVVSYALHRAQPNMSENAGQEN
jgi:hypothetical protein